MNSILNHLIVITGFGTAISLIGATLAIWFRHRRRRNRIILSIDHPDGRVVEVSTEKKDADEVGRIVSELLNKMDEQKAYKELTDGNKRGGPKELE